MKDRSAYLLIGSILIIFYIIPPNSIPSGLSGSTNLNIIGDSVEISYGKRNTLLHLGDQSLTDLRVSQQEHHLTSPNITSPTKGETYIGSILIEWTKAIDSQGHNVRYTVFCSTNQITWKPLETNISKNNCTWDTSQADWTGYYIKVEATSSAGLRSNDIEGPITILNWLRPPTRVFLAFFLLIIIVVIIIGAMLYRKHISSATGVLIRLDDPKIMKFGLCLGSFTDKGLIIKVKNNNCNFSHQQIQSMLEYSAVLFQDGKAETMYGPIPLANLKEKEDLMDPLQTEWNFISYWMNVKDSTVEDSRITKIGGVVPAALLLFYPKQLDHMVIVYKNKIINIIKSLIHSDTDISNFTNDTLNYMEKELLKLFI